MLSHSQKFSNFSDTKFLPVFEIIWLGSPYLAKIFLHDFINFLYKQIFELEKVDRRPGIEPGSLDYMPSVIPLDHQPSCFSKLISLILHVFIRLSVLNLLYDQEFAIVIKNTEIVLVNN